MISALLMALLAQPPAEKDACQISGTVELRRNGVRKELPDQVVVFVRKVDEKTWTTKEEADVIQQHNKQFAPKLKVVLENESIDFVNIDPATDHNVVLVNQKGRKVNVGTSKNDKTGTYPFKKQGLVHVRCNIHPGMAAEVFVLQNPYFAVASANGAFQLPPLPAGKDYEIVAQEVNGASKSRKITSCIGKQVPQTFQFEANQEVALGKPGDIDIPGSY